MDILPRICISSTSGSGGKTLLSLGLCVALKNADFAVKPFKKGPDYIDAAWLTLACQRPATNLDLYFLNPQSIKNLFAQSMLNADIAIIEGNRGLFDGLDETGSCSTAALARVLDAPILLCIDCAKSTRTIAAIINGLVNFERGLTFSGVILNKIGSSRHEAALRRAIEVCTDLPILGVLPRTTHNPLPERHMGLASQSFIDNSREQLEKLGDFISSHCNLEAIIKAANRPFPEKIIHSAPLKIKKASNKPINIGYVCDEALWFYYPENLQALEEAGAELIKLSLFEQSENNLEAWENISALYLGGGFPEDYAEQISNSPFLHKIKYFSNKGMPIYAECGGLMILCTALKNQKELWPMSGIFPAIAHWLPRPQGLGYVEGTIVQSNPYFPLGTKIRGHEFHYSHCNWTNEHPSFVMNLSRGKGLGGEAIKQDGILYKNTWASYTHIFAPALPCWAENFTLAAQKFYQPK